MITDVALLLWHIDAWVLLIDTFFFRVMVSLIILATYTLSSLFCCLLLVIHRDASLIVSGLTLPLFVMYLLYLSLLYYFFYLSYLLYLLYFLLLFIIFNSLYFKYNNNKGRGVCFLVSRTAETTIQDYDGSW